MMEKMVNLAGRLQLEEITDYLQPPRKIQSFVWPPRGRIRWRQSREPESERICGGRDPEGTTTERLTFSFW